MKRHNTRQVKTYDLKAGDLVVFADLVDQVISVDLTDSAMVATVNVKRLNYDVYTFWYAGFNSIQDVIIKED